MSTLFLDTLDEERRKTFRKLSRFAGEFTLAGGTAIMLLANHRKSFDFDCFSEKPLKGNLLRKAREVFGDTISIQVDNPDLLLFTTPEGAKIDFVNFPYPPIYPSVLTDSIPLLDLLYLAANKAYTIGRRATWRDYVDLFFLEKKLGLAKIINAAKTKFKGEFSDKLFLEQLVYFDDLEILPIEFVERSYSKKEIQDYLQRVVKEFTCKKLSVKPTE